MKRIVVLAAFLTICHLAAGTLPAAAAPPVADPGAPGPFLVGHTSFVLTDLSRPGGPDFEFRPVPVEVWYPVDAASITEATPEAVYALDVLYGLAPQTLSSDWEKYGIDRAYEGPPPAVERPFPLVVFSPGWGAAAWFHLSVGTRLASHGFVVAVLYHYGDWVWPWEPFDHLGIASWNRPRDVSFVLSDLLVKNEGGSGHLLSGTIRPDQVAASGWSLGGYASMVLAGGDDSVCDKVAEAWDPADPPPDWTCSPSWPDPRIRAIVPLDGSSQLLYFDELSRVVVPALGIGEEWSYLAIDAGWEAWQARHHAAFSGKPAYRVDVFNSNHQSFSDMCESIHVLTDLGVGHPCGSGGPPLPVPLRPVHPVRRGAPSDLQVHDRVPEDESLRRAGLPRDPHSRLRPHEGAGRRVLRHGEEEPEVDLRGLPVELHLLPAPARQHAVPGGEGPRLDAPRPPGDGEALMP